MTDLFLVPKADVPAADSTTPDWEARQQALDVQQSWIVEAPAGSGKTGLLIQRYLKLLADESVDEPEQVLAITFTTKATSEIRDRVLAQLLTATKPDQSKNDFERQTRALAEAVLRHDESLGWGLLEHPRRFNIRTIDSVCAEIAGSLPVLSGSGGGLSPVEDATLMYRQAARQALLQLGGEDASLNDALRSLLLHRNGEMRDCERLIAEMLALRDQWGELVPLDLRQLDDAYLDETVLPQLERALDQAVCAGLAELNRSVPGDILEELSALAGEMGLADGYKGAPSPIAILAGMESTPGETAEYLEHWQALTRLLTTADGEWRSGFHSGWLRFDLGKTHAARLKSLVEDLRHRDDVLRAIKRVTSLPPRTYPQEQWQVLKALFRVLLRALAELQLVFAEHGECDFAELGLQARTALRREGAIGDLAAALGMKLQHLLVDEMQDTSTSQYELIQLLTQGWDGRSQTVFLVGDPKQSIYLFRQARVERFVRTMLSERLGDLPVRCLRLTANFRSQSPLVDAFNQDFSLLFPAEVNDATPEEVPYVAASSVRGPSENGAGAVWHANVLPPGLSAEKTRGERRKQDKADAPAVRAIVERWRSRPLPEGRSEPWKIAVLVRNRNHLVEIVAALKDGAIPFRAVDIEVLGERHEVLDLFALTRALLHPVDRVAWLAVLHAPWCGLGLADLHTFTGADDPDLAERSIEGLIEERGHLLSEESCARLARIWRVLRAAAQQRSRLTMAQWVEKTWRSLGGDTYLQPAGLVNARRYLQLLDELEEQAGTMDLSLLKRRLEKLFAPPSVTAGAVDLMTIHGAKGLEWDVVIVPGLEKKSRTNAGRLLAWNEFDSDDDTVAPIVLAPIAGKGSSEELNKWLRSIENAREAAERKRLFYVACTRAREELHLFATARTSARGAIHPPPSSLLHTAWPAAERHFAATPAVPGAASKVAVVPTAALKDEFAGDLAASSEATTPRLLQRLPLAFDPSTRFEIAKPLPYGESEIAPGTPHFERPEGSFEARAFGNAVHTFLETLAKRINAGVATDKLLREVAGWSPRIGAVLRADGVPPPLLVKRSSQVITVLSNTLRDAEGLWVISAHPDAASEYALTSWKELRQSVRLDRIFRAGPKPLDVNHDHDTNGGCLWIVDYKTTAHGPEGVDRFLLGERAKYGPQMEAYARMMKEAAKVEDVRLGLYYPMLPRLIWWTPQTTSPEHTPETIQETT